MRAANASSLSIHEAGPDTTVLAGRRGEALDAAREVVEAALDAGAGEVRIKVEAQGESAKFGSAGGRRAPARARRYREAIQRKGGGCRRRSRSKKSIA